MKFNFLVIAVLALSLSVFVSCKEEKEATPTQSDVELNENPKTTADVNPAHGEPNHRCDIPVGAPLDQAAANTTTTQQRTSTNTSTTSPVRVQGTNSSTPTKNPPHGEPGHSCSVPVGADLN